MPAAATLPPAPDCSFASDNSAGAHPVVLQAMIEANHGHALAYGNDRWTAEATARIRDLFGGAPGRPVEAFLVWNGTGANVMALGSMVPPAGAVVCSTFAHIAVDETGAPERIVGSKLMAVEARHAKLLPAQIEELAQLRGEMHHAQPEVVSITQSTELGAVYTPSEVAAICETAHRAGMLVHMDGARVANATAALGGTVAALRSFTVDAGVDVISFGGTKAGLVGGEAVVYLDAELARRAAYVRKMTTQLPSKMRFVAAQFNALLADDLWIRLAEHANAMSDRLYTSVADLPAVAVGESPQVNSLFPILPPSVIEPLRAWCFFYDWDSAIHQVRWMTAWDTTPADVERFAAGVAAAVATV